MMYWVWEAASGEEVAWVASRVLYGDIFCDDRVERSETAKMKSDRKRRRKGMGRERKKDGEREKGEERSD